MKKLMTTCAMLAVAVSVTACGNWWDDMWNGSHEKARHDQGACRDQTVDPAKHWTERHVRQSRPRIGMFPRGGPTNLHVSTGLTGPPSPQQLAAPSAQGAPVVVFQINAVE